MGIVDLIRGRRAKDSQAVTGVFRMGRASYNATSWGFTRIANSIYANPTGHRCFNMLETHFSRPDWSIYKPGTTDAIDSHPLLDILNSPNAVAKPKGGAMSGTLMQRVVYQNLNLVGRSIWLKLHGADGMAPVGPTTGLKYLAPHRVTVLGNDDDELVGFIYADRSGRRQPMLPEDVVYLRYPHPDRYYDGFPPALVAGLPAETDNLSQRFNYDMLSNDGAVPGVIIVQGLTPSAFNQFRANWEAKEYPGKTRFIGGDEAQYIKIGQSNQELTYHELREDSKQDICHALGVPKVLIEPTDATFANYDGAKSTFIEGKIAPDWVLVADEMTAQLGEEFGVDIGFDLSVVGELQETADKVVDREIKLIGVQASTPNALLKMLGREPVPWGDKPIMPVAPLKPAIQQPPSGEAAPPPAVPSAKAMLESIEDAEAFRLDVMRLMAEAPPRETAAARVIDVDAFRRRVATYEARAQRHMAAYFKRQGKVVVAKLTRGAGKNASTYLQRFTADDDALPSERLLDRDRWDGELADDTESLLAEITDAFGSAAAGDLGAEAFDAASQRLRDYITNRSTQVAGLVNDTTEAELRTMLADLTDQGMGIDAIVAQIRDYFDNADGRASIRAETFARTETIGAGNYATLEAARQSGVATGKTWLAAGDCKEQECNDLDGTSVGLDEEFDGGYDAPPAHPNCRCALLIQTSSGTEEDDNG